MSVSPRSGTHACASRCRSSPTAPDPPDLKGHLLSHLLFEPITRRGLTVRNRIWVPPMCQYSVETDAGIAAPWHYVHYGSLARGGAGAGIVEATGGTPVRRIAPKDLGLWTVAQRDALPPIVDFVLSQGAAAGSPVAPAGRKAST